jgi:hypothetical protein
MGLFRLALAGNHFCRERLIEATGIKLALEKHLENWLEHNPAAHSGEALFCIGRHASAAVDE